MMVRILRAFRRMQGVERRIVYIIRSESDPSRHYTGITNDVKGRLEWHNSGPSGYTIHNRPWSLVVSIEFPTENAARRFEKYLKSGSGRAFTKRHFGLNWGDREHPSKRSRCAGRVVIFIAIFIAPDRWEELAEALRLQHLTQDGQPAGPTVQGRKFTIRAILNGPTGQSALVISVWFIPAGGEVPRFVTAYPGDGLWVYTLDVVVLNTDLPAQGLKRGDLGAVVDVYSPDAMEVEFVTASGRTQALITLRPSDIREVGDDDLVAVRPAGTSPIRDA